mgnify:CR=1 FL=1
MHIRYNAYKITTLIGDVYSPMNTFDSAAIKDQEIYAVQKGKKNFRMEYRQDSAGQMHWSQFLQLRVLDSKTFWLLPFLCALKTCTPKGPLKETMATALNKLCGD